MTTQGATQEAIDAGKKAVTKMFQPKDGDVSSVFKIGRPSRFSNDVDRNQRIHKYLKSKMNLVDIIPCDYQFPLAKASELQSNSGNVMEAVTPVLSYGQSIEEFQKVCGVYGMPKQPGALRLYLTDATSASDEFSNSYSDNLLQGAYNKLSSFGQQLNSLGRSVSSSFQDVASDGADAGGKYAGNIAKNAAGAVGMSEQSQSTIQQSVQSLASTSGKILFAGNRITLPKIWSNSDYSPNFTCVVKLVSPFGHPDAIQRFIIQPLMYLLIMSSARTSDGVSYGGVPNVTVKGYGLTYLPLATISSISLRKGGPDTSFNVYKQPLTIDVSITFQSLLSGFAVFNKENAADPGNGKIYSGTNTIEGESSKIQAGQRALFSTLGSVVDSLRPRGIEVPKHEEAKIYMPKVVNQTQKQTPAYRSSGGLVANQGLSQLIAESKIQPRTPPLNSDITHSQRIATNTVAQEHVQEQIATKPNETIQQRIRKTTA